MGHYRLADSMPSAIILAKNPRTSSLDELKSYQDNIFLNTGTEFQIKLFNPLQEKIGARISMNGKISNHLLVLNPGEDVIVDRFVDDQRRMKFDTYEYDSGNSLAKKAIQNNGDIEISFFKEYQQSTVTITSGTYYMYDTPSTLTIGDQFIDLISTGNVGLGNTSPDSSINCTTTNTNNEFVSPDISFKEKDLSSVGEVRTKSAKSKKLTKSLKKETGRIEKGEKSDQLFESIELNFNTMSFHTIRYKLKPMSEKTQNITEVREYCNDCGYRLRNKSWSFCPKCGGKV